MKTLKTAILLTFIGLNIASHAQDTIPTVKIGDQVWMVTILAVVTFRNGDTIDEAQNL